jgi:hypothetical protein
MLPVRIGNREDRLIVEGLLTRQSSRKEGEVYVAAESIENGGNKETGPGNSSFLRKGDC